MPLVLGSFIGHTTREGQEEEVYYIQGRGPEDVEKDGWAKRSSDTGLIKKLTLVSPKHGSRTFTRLKRKRLVGNKRSKIFGSKCAKEIAMTASGTRQGALRDCGLVAAMDQALMKPALVRTIFDLYHGYEKKSYMPVNLFCDTRRICFYGDMDLYANYQNQLAFCRNLKGLLYPCYLEDVVGMAFGGFVNLNAGGSAIKFLQLLTGSHGKKVHLGQLAARSIFKTIYVAAANGDLILFASLAESDASINPELLTNHFYSYRDLKVMVIDGIKEAVVFLKNCHCRAVIGPFHPSGSIYPKLNDKDKHEADISLVEVGTTGILLSKLPSKFSRIEISKASLTPLPIPCANPSRIHHNQKDKDVWVFEDTFSANQNITHSVTSPAGVSSVEVILFEKDWLKNPMSKTKVKVKVYNEFCSRLMGSSAFESTNSSTTLRLKKETKMRVAPLVSTSEEEVQYKLVVIATLDPSPEIQLPEEFDDVYQESAEKKSVVKAMDGMNLATNEDCEMERLSKDGQVNPNTPLLTGSAAPKLLKQTQCPHV